MRIVSVYNKLSFTLDNIIYNCTSKGKDDIEIILPRKAPSSTEYSSKYSKEKSVVLEPAVQIEIKLFLTIETSTVPKIYIHGEDKKSKINYTTKLELQAKTINLLTFTTTDGGQNWLVTPVIYSKSPTIVPSEVVTTVNNKKGPTIVLDANDIHLNGDTGPTIIQQFEAVETKIIDLKQTIVSEVTGDVAEILPDMINLQIQNTKIVAEVI